MGKGGIHSCYEYKMFFWVGDLVFIISSFCSNSSTDKLQTLHTELDSVQALRGQLEEVLSRTRSMALALERAAKRQPDFGGGNGQGLPSTAAFGTLTNAP